MEETIRTFCAILIILVISSTVVADTTESVSPNSLTVTTIPRQNSYWKDTKRFEISAIEGLKGEYLAGEPVVLVVSGKSDDMDVGKVNGFYVVGALGCPLDGVWHGAKVEYDAGMGKWKLQFSAPSKPKEYQISVSLLCAPGENPCANMFGAGSWVTEISRIRVAPNTSSSAGE